MSTMRRLTSGQLTHPELFYFVAAWFVMDVIQFLNMVAGWFK